MFWWLLLHLFPGFALVSGYDVCGVWFHVILVWFWFYVVGGLVGCVACGMLVFGFGDVFVFVIWVVLGVI